MTVTTVTMTVMTIAMKLCIYYPDNRTMNVYLYVGRSYVLGMVMYHIRSMR